MGLFLFLKFFAKNVYRVPPLYQDGTIAVPSGCNEITTPYLLPDSIFTRVAGISKPADTTRFVVFSFPGADVKAETDQLNRVKEAFEAHIAAIVAEWNRYDATALNQLRQCVFLMDGKEGNTLLVDGEGRIRGYYDATSREDVDRLKTELTIMLSRY